MSKVFSASQVLTASEIVDFQTNRADKFKVSFTDVLQNRILIFNTGRAPTDDIQLRKVRLIILATLERCAGLSKRLAF